MKQQPHGYQHQGFKADGDMAVHHMFIQEPMTASKGGGSNYLNTSVALAQKEKIKDNCLWQLTIFGDLSPSYQWKKEAHQLERADSCK